MSTHRLARTGDTDKLIAALERGSDVNELDEFNATPIHYAIAHKHLDLALALINHGASLIAQNREGTTPLQSAIEHGLQDFAARLAIDDPRVLHVSDHHGNEPLWTAAFNARGSYSLVVLLLHLGADPHHQNRVGFTPIDVASRIGDDSLLEILEGIRSLESVYLQPP